MIIAFQGVHGAYSEVALKKVFGDHRRSLPSQTFEEVFRNVRGGQARYGIIPIENSLAGSIHQNYDLLLRFRIPIVAETYLRIEHALMCHRSIAPSSIRTVRSHPQALAQCGRFFRTHRRLTPEMYFDTAGAAASLADGSAGPTGAIASTLAARLYGLRIVRRHLEDREENFTRFLVIGERRLPLAGRTERKTSLVFMPEKNRAGILWTILGTLTRRNINLVKIESRPDPGSPFEYVFYADIVGAPDEPAVAEALADMSTHTRRCTILGSYHIARFPRR